MTYTDYDPMEELIQMNVRIPVRLKSELMKYLEYMGQDEGRRPTETEDWPDTLSAVARQALEHFLYTHPRSKRTRLKGGTILPPADPNSPMPISRIQPKRRLTEPTKHRKHETATTSDRDRVPYDEDF